VKLLTPPRLFQIQLSPLSLAAKSSNFSRLILQHRFIHLDLPENYSHLQHMMDTDDLVIIGNEFTMKIEEELPQHSTAYLMDNKQTKGDLNPQMLSAAPNLINKEVWLCHGCSAWDVGATHHERSIHPRSPPCEAARRGRHQEVEGQCQADVANTGSEPLVVHYCDSLEPVMDHQVIQLPYHERTVGSESLDKPQRFSPPVRHNHLLRWERTKHTKAATSTSCMAAKQRNNQGKPC
jgi:hypothetical protein